MKQCPACQTQYDDDSFQFCLQDGSILQFAAGSQSKTLVLNEQETVVSNRPSNQISAPPVTNQTGWTPNQYSSNANYQTPEKKSNTTFAVLATALGMLLLFGFVSLGAWVYFSKAKTDDNTNILLAKKSPYPDKMSTNSSSSAPLMPTSTPLTSNLNAVSNVATVDKEQIKRDISQRISSWKSGTESGNINSYINLYAETLDYYYTKRNISRETVRNDKQKAFNQFSYIEVNLTNLNIMPDDSGEKATAVFDKEWVFDGTKRFAGKVQAQLQFKKIGGQWLITGEKDLKVYYTQK